MSYRRAIALISLASCMVALYLALWKMGYMGRLSCGAAGDGGCEYVQGSRYGWFLGVDVALIGTIGYAAIVAVALAGTSEALEDARWPTQLLMVLIYGAVLFTLRLKYAEFVLLKSFCPWCAVSAVAITLDAILVTLDWRRVRDIAGAPPVLIQDPT
ncbi:MAG TPA: vitamin K epoxide reductase family protein [Gemmatimonadaceae bacterium]|nr:vitamin K epoxide reductase family protein [Gemmatimonadaceae bacterium]